jgi:flavin reductase (DIM6/NTAB) family NADH-FMN oxidoreductase RutF
MTQETAIENTWRTFDPQALSPTEMYHLLNALVIPRPIAWVSTIGANGVANLAPHSYFTILSPDPPIVCFSSMGEKDTLRNVRFTRDFVINVVPEELAEKMNLTSADFPPDESEFAFTGLTPLPSLHVRAPRLAESPANLECRLHHIIELGNAPNYVVLGEVVHVHVAERVMRGDRVDPSRIRPLGRLSGAGYVAPGTFFDMPRPTYAGLMAALQAAREDGA